MKRSYVLLVTALLAGTAAACDSFKEAFTAHADQVARAEGQDLTTERLAKLIGNSQIPVRKDVAGVVAGFWVSYQLLGHAGANGDALPESTTKNWWVKDTKAIDEAMWASILTARVQHFYEKEREKFAKPDTMNAEPAYAQSEALAGQHILFLMPQDGAGMSEQKKDSIRRKAEGVLKQVTSANFGEMAKKYSEDPGSKNNNGTYAMFPPGAMVPEFEQGIRALKPGEISPTLIKTQHGYHIVRRHLFAEVRPQFLQYLMQSNEGKQRDAWVTKFRTDYKVEYKPKADSIIKAVAQNPQDAHTNNAVIASSRLGNFTAARLSEWIDVIPPQANIRQQLTTAPDSMARKIVGSLIDQEVIGDAAKKAGVEPDTTEVKQIRGYFTQLVNNAMAGLGVDPATIGDSAKSTTEKEKLAATRVEEALDRLFATNGQSMVDVPPQVAAALRKKYSARVNNAGLDRAVERSTQIRTVADSARGQAPPQPTMTQPPPIEPPGKQTPPPAGKKQ